MDITKKIKLKQDERETHVTAMEVVMTAASDEERGLTDEEQTDFDNNESMIKTIDIEIGNLERMEAAVGVSRAQPVKEVSDDPKRTPATMKYNHDPKLFLARQAHALFMTEGSRGDAAAYCKQIGDDEMSAIMRVPKQIMNVLPLSWVIL